MKDQNVSGTEWKKQRDRLVNTAFLTMLEHTDDIFFIKDMQGIYQAASMPFVRLVGKQSPEDIIGRTDFEVFENAELARRYVADDRKLLENGTKLESYTESIMEGHGESRYGFTTKYVLLDEAGNQMGILGVTRDITRDYIARQHYQKELQYLFELPENAYAISYIDVDSWRIITQRRRLIEEGTIQATHTVELLCQGALEAIEDKNCEAAQFYRNFTPMVLKEIYSSGRPNLTFKYQRRMSNGLLKWVENDVRFLIDADNGHLCAMLSAVDIDAEKMEVQKLSEAARVDRMTGLLNRETTMASIQKILQEEAGYSHALLMVDVDNFKLLNDTMGHQKGDEFLIALTAEIKKCFRGSDIVGRIGGDEFFAWMRNVTSLSSVARKAQEMMEVIQQVCRAYAEVPLSGSIGISVYPENGRTLKELYAQADGALYQAKRQGKNRFVFADLEK